jgi:hypothetical protein
MGNAGRALCFIVCAYTALFILRVAVHPDQNLWDFQKDYYWTKAFVHGLNPYDVKTVTSLADRPHFPFLYMPLSLLFFAPFTFLSCATARMIALGFYAAVLLITFIAFSRRLIALRGIAGLFSLFAVLAFNGAINKSIHTGNVASLETALIFLAFMCWLKGRHAWFLLFIFAASLFKLTPLFFLGLTFFDRTPRWRSAAIFLGVFLLAEAIPFRVMSISLHEWLPYANANVGGCQCFGYGYINPSALCMLKDLLTRGGTVFVLKPLLSAVFALWVVAVFYFTVRAGVFLFKEGRDESRVDLVVLAILCYALVLPRFQDYYWVLLIPAVFRVLMVREYARTVGPLMVFCLLPQREDTFPGLSMYFKIAAFYLPLLVAFGTWLLLVLNIRKRQSQNTTTTR